MKKLLLTSLFALVSFGAVADMPQPPMNMPNGDGPHMDMMSNLTDDQKSCIEKFDCKMPERPNMQTRPEMQQAGERPDRQARPEMPPRDEKSEKPKMPERDFRPEMTDEQKEAMECMQKAMKECGIEMPEKPDAPHDQRFQGQNDNMPEPSVTNR